MRTKCQYRQASKENWKRFCELHPHIKHLSYVDYQNIIYTFNYGFRDYMLETGFKAKYPWGIGDFAICKFKRKLTRTLPDGTEVDNAPVDWKRTKETGIYVKHMNRHTDGYGFKWKWYAHTARYKYSDVWVFSPSRLTSRILSHYLKQPGQHHKYFNWK